jgi:hypothetical protein
MPSINRSKVARTAASGVVRAAVLAGVRGGGGGGLTWGPLPDGLAVGGLIVRSTGVLLCAIAGTANAKNATANTSFIICYSFNSTDLSIGYTGRDRMFKFAYLHFAKLLDQSVKL